MTIASVKTSNSIDQAVCLLHSGGIIAYPTEYCFGLGCDPRNDRAIERLLKVKHRHPEQGVILIASSVDQVSMYVDLGASPILSTVLDSWPGPNTWLLPALNNVSAWVKGHHSTVAVRVTAHPISQQLCAGFGGAIVSTSANRHGKPALLDARSVNNDMGSELDIVVDELVGGASSASVIRDGITGKQLR